MPTAQNYQEFWASTVWLELDDVSEDDYGDKLCCICSEEYGVAVQPSLPDRDIIADVEHPAQAATHVPVKLGCGHTFGGVCVLFLLQNLHYQCPLCKDRFIDPWHLEDCDCENICRLRRRWEEDRRPLGNVYDNVWEIHNNDRLPHATRRWTFDSRQTINFLLVVFTLLLVVEEDRLRRRVSGRAARLERLIYSSNEELVATFPRPQMFDYHWQNFMYFLDRALDVFQNRLEFLDQRPLTGRQVHDELMECVQDVYGPFDPRTADHPKALVIAVVDMFVHAWVRRQVMKDARLVAEACNWSRIEQLLDAGIEPPITWTPECLDWAVTYIDVTSDDDLFRAVEREDDRRSRF